MNTKVLPILVSFLLIPGLAMAQQGTVAGTVLDAETGESLPGASVQIPAEGSGTATDADGEFSLRVAEGEYELQVSFVGYDDATRSVTVRAGTTTRIRVQLQPSAAQLGEVVVTGLGQQKTRAEASISVSSVDAAGLTETGDFQSVQELFQGSTPGVTVSKTSGNVGAGIRFNMRNNISLNSDGQPLIFIDGVRVNQDEFGAPGQRGFEVGGQGTSPLADINPDNIRSVEILKGPAASALYGTDGADGAVLIETKSGRQGQALQVDYSTTLGYNERVEEYDSTTIATAEAVNNTFREGEIQEHQVSASGSFGDVNYFTSYSRRYTKGILQNNNGTRNNFQANFDINPNEEWKIGATSKLSLNRLRRPNNDNSLAGWIGGTVVPSVPYLFRDSTEIGAINNSQRVRRFIGSVNVTYTPEFLTGLRVQAKAGSDVSTRRQDQTFPVGFTTSFPGIDNGSRSFYNLNKRNFNGDLNASYDYIITENLSATSTLGAQVFTESSRGSNATAEQFATPKISDIGTGASLEGVGEFRENSRSAGVFARQTFSYNNRYNLDVSVRRDWSTKLLVGGRDSYTAFYPSARANVRLGQFEFVPESVTQLKVRGAFGQSGSLPDVTDTQLTRLGGERGGFGPGGVLSSAGNPDLEAETVSEIEGGVDITINDRYTLSATYYRQSTENSIVDFSPAPSSGLGLETVPRNVGEITGQGIETSLDLTLVDRDNFRADFSGNYSWQTSEVQELGDQVLQGGFESNHIVEGLPPGAFYGLDLDGGEFKDGEVVPNFVDQNGDGEITLEDRTQLGNPNPDHFGGFSLSLQLFEDLTISGRAEYQLGHQVHNATQQFATRAFVIAPNDPRVPELRGRLGELEQGTPEFENVVDRLAELQTSDDVVTHNFVEDADFLKIRELSVGYDLMGLAGRYFENVPLRQFRIQFSAQNVFTFTEYSGPDPQVNSTGSRTITQNYDFLTLQTPRSYTGTISIGF